MRRPDGVTLGEAARVWWLVGLNSFGGPGAQIPLLHRMVVEERRWVSERRFLHGLNFSMLLPGPEAQQLATYLGWALHGIRGGLIAGGLFILPGFVAILALSVAYVTVGDTDAVAGLFYGIKPAVMALVLVAVVRLGRRAVRSPALVGIAAAGFLAVFVFAVPFPLVVLGAGLVGLVGGRLAPDAFFDGHVDPEGPASAPTARPIGTGLVVVAGLVVWMAPLAVITVVGGTGTVWFDLAAFFTVAAVVTFGGAYAVLAFIAQQAVQAYGWLLPGEMVDGLGMAETTPGPAIQVVQFVGFLGAYRLSGGTDPMIAAIGGAVLVTWVTFAPSFLWIFAGAPHIDRLQGRRGMTAALNAITAAVVGVIANLGAWFGLHTLFPTVGERRIGILRIYVPEWVGLDIVAAVLAVLGVVALTRLRWPVLRMIVVGAAIGAAWYLAVLR